MERKGNDLLVSIIIPIYNAEKYLEKCLQSILVQTYENIEVILVDDGSVDGSGLICDEYARKDARIKVKHKMNEGTVRARIDGIHLATGTIIAFSDADDWMEPNMISRLYCIMQEEAVDVIMCGRYEDTEDMHREIYPKHHNGRYDKQRLMKEIYPRLIADEGFFEWGVSSVLWDKLYRRECIEPYLISVDENIAMGDDAACVYPCLLQADSIYILHECLYHYRQTPTSMIKNSTNIILEQEKFRVLYNSVLGLLEMYKEVPTLSEQWRSFVLFLMVPRAEQLYRHITELDYLFPFPKVKRGSNVIIYGMGTYGQFLYNYLEKTHFCNVVAAADRNYVELRKQGFAVISPKEMEQYECDAIVVASSFAKARTAIYQELTSRFPKEKVHVIDEELIKSEETMAAFGLL